MKKTLFLSAILGAALCQTTWADTQTVTVGTTTYEGTSVMSTGTTLDAAPEGDYILITGEDSKSAVTISSTSNAWATAETLNKTIIAAQATYDKEGHDTVSQWGRLHVDNATVYADIIAGGTSGDAIWLSGTASHLKGTLTAADGASSIQIWSDSGKQYIDGDIAASKTLLKVVGNKSTLHLNGSSTLGKLQVTETNTVDVNGALNFTGSTESYSVQVDNSATVNFKGAKTYTLAKMLGVAANAKVTIGDGTTVEAQRVYYSSTGTSNGSLTVNSGGTLTISGTDDSSLSTLTVDGTASFSNSKLNVSALTIGSAGEATFKNLVLFKKDNASAIHNAGTLTTTNATLLGGSVVENTGTLKVTGTLTVNDGTSTLKGNATLNNISIGDSATKMLVIDGGTVTSGNINGQVLNGSSARIGFANGGNLTSTGRIWTNNSTLYLKNTTADGVTTGGMLTMKGFLSGSADGTTSAGNLSIDEKVTLKITGTATAPASGGTDNGFIIWNGSAHTYTINGSLIIEGGIRAQKMGSATGTTSSSETFNISSTGLLQLNQGITYVTADNTLESMGTINVKGGTLAIGGQTTGSKKAEAVNLADGSTLKALDATTSTAQVFTLADNATVNLNADAGKALTLSAALNNATASVIAQGGGTVSLGNATLAAVTAKENTVVTFGSSAAISSAITVESGSRVEMKDATPADVALAGGTIKVTATNDFNGQHFASLTLTANSTLDLTAQNSGLINKDNDGFTTATLNLGTDKKLTINGTKRFCIIDTETTGTGTIAYATNGGYLQIAHSQITGHTADLSHAVVELNGTHVDIASGNTLKVAGLAHSSKDNASTIEQEHSTGSANLTQVLEIVGNGGQYTYYGKFNSDTKVDLSMTGAGTQNFDLTDNATLSSLTATAGTMNFYLNEHTLSTGSLTLNGGEVNVFTAEGSSSVGQITTTNNLTVAVDTNMEANLVVNGGTLTFAKGAVLTMGCDVTIEGSTVYVTIDSTFDDFMAGLRAGNTSLVVIDGLESADEAKALTLSGLYVTDSTGNTFTNNELGLKVVANTYTGNGDYAIVVAPEPATATLSLLALASLCARRRRH